MAPVDASPAIRIEGRGPMRISVTEAKGRLSELIRRAEADEEVLLTRHGRVIVRLVPVGRSVADKRRAVIAAVRVTARKQSAGPSAARSQDVLYDKDGLPNGA